MALRRTIEHNGETLDVEICWEQADSYGLSGLYFEVDTIGDRKATQEEVERLDEELQARYESDKDFADDIGESIYDYQCDRAFGRD